MKILLVGEGPDDCGWEDNGNWEDGPVQVYLRRLIDGVDILTRHKSQIKQMRSNKRQRRTFAKLKGHSAKAFFISQAAVANGCDCAAMYVDADRSGKTPHECQTRYDGLKEEVLYGLRTGADIHALAIIPMKMIESWMLGDRNAFFRLYRKKLDPDYFRRPELIWGDKDDRTSDFPKNKLERALAECGIQLNRCEYPRIAYAQDIEELCRTCPISFGDFHAQVMDIIGKS